MTPPETGIPREFEIPVYNQRRQFGVFLAAHAIPDAVNVMHTGVGCKPKAQRQITMHDRGREAQNKMVWSDISDAHLIQGSAEALRNITLETYHRREGVGLILVTASSAMELTGIDLPGLVRELRADIGCAVEYVPAPGTQGDHYDGYADVIQVVLDHCHWDAPVTYPQQVNLLGYPFDRYELDHQANLREVRRLLAGIGADVGQVLLSGAPFPDLQRAPDAGANLVLPWARAVPDPRLDALGRPHRRVTLPMSGRGTRRFLDETAALLGLPRRRVAALAQREERKIAPMLRIARELLEGRRVALLADTPRAVGLASVALELGLKPGLVGLLDHSLGGASTFTGGLHHLGLALPDGCPVLPAPTLSELDRAARDARREAGDAPFDLLIAPDLWLPPPLADGVPRVEMGLPANRKHGLYAMPELGWNGLVALAQRFLDGIHRVH